MALADRIREALKAKGMTQQDLADQLGITRPAVSQWLKRSGGGRATRPGHENLIKMAKILDRDVAWLLTGVSSGVRDRFELVYFETDDAGRQWLDQALEREAERIASRKQSE